MTVTVRGTDILFNDGSTQSTAYKTDNGVGGVGSFCFGTNTDTSIGSGSTTGAFKSTANRGNAANSYASLGGTWRNVTANTLGNSGCNVYSGTFQRIA
jgi:hypothetical protein